MSCLSFSQSNHFSKLCNVFILIFSIIDNIKLLQKSFHIGKFLSSKLFLVLLFLINFMTVLHFKVLGHWSLLFSLQSLFCLHCNIKLLFLHRKFHGIFLLFFLVLEFLVITNLLTQLTIGCMCFNSDFLGFSFSFITHTWIFFLPVVHAISSILNQLLISIDFKKT